MNLLKMLCLVAICPGLVASSPISAQEQKPRATLKGHIKGVRSVAFSPDGKTLASGSYDNTIKLWDVGTGKEKSTLRGHTKIVTSVAFSPDGKTLASGSLDGTIKLWDVSTEREKVTWIHIRGVESLAFSPDGQTLASGGNAVGPTLAASQGPPPVWKY